MTISQQEFEKLDPDRQVILDSTGRQWDVIANRENTGGDVPGKREVILRAPGNSSESFGWWDGNVVDEEIGIVVELNHPNARVINKQSLQ